MTRPLRLEFPGALWHVMNRGVERRTLFLDDRDRRLFLGLLEQTVGKSRWRLHAYERIRSRDCSREHPHEQRQFRAQTIDSLLAAFRTRGAMEFRQPATGVARAAFVILADRHTNTNHAERGRHLGISGQAAGQLLRRSQHRLASDRALAELIEKIEGVLSAEETMFRVST